MTEDRDIMSGLMQQVARAVPKGGSERDVTTVITQPMWDKWCKATGIPVGTPPSDWQGVHQTHRVYGSETIVVQSERHASASYSNLPTEDEQPSR